MKLVLVILGVAVLVGGRTDDVEWCFFASQEERAMKLKLSSASERAYDLTFTSDPPSSIPNPDEASFSEM